MAKGAFAAGNYLKAVTAPIVAVPLTMFAAFYPLTTHQGRLLRLGQTGGNGYWGIQVLATGFVAGDTLNDTGSGSGNPQDSTYTANSWNYCTCVYAATNNRTIYLNGNAGVNSTTNSAAPTTPTQINVGINGDLTTPFNGYIQDAAIWNVALDTAEIAALHKGISPELIRPANLQFYAPLIRGIQNTVGLTLAETGTVPVQNHNRVILAVGNNDGIGNNE